MVPLSLDSANISSELYRVGTIVENYHLYDNYQQLTVCWRALLELSKGGDDLPWQGIHETCFHKMKDRVTPFPRFPVPHYLDYEL